MIDTIKKAETISSAEHPCLSWSEDRLTISCGSSWLTLADQGEPLLRLRGKEQLKMLGSALLDWRAKADSNSWLSDTLESTTGCYHLSGNRNGLEYVIGHWRLQIGARILCDLCNWLLLNQGIEPHWDNDENLVDVKQCGNDPLLQITAAFMNDHSAILPRFKGRHADDLVANLLLAAATPHDITAKSQIELGASDYKLILIPALAASWRLHYTIIAGIVGRDRSVELSRTSLVHIARQVQALRKGE